MVEGADRITRWRRVPQATGNSMVYASWCEYPQRYP